MKLFTKDINQKLFAQYRIGSNLNKQKVVAKIFNPYGEGRWYLLNSDPNDPDYLWAIVQMGDNVEIGSVSRSELERARIKPFGLPLERDTYFSDRVAIEVLEGLEKGQTFAAGGMTAGRWYKDNSGKEFRFIGESEGKLLFKDGEKIITKSEEDFEDAPKEKKLFGIFAEGGETEDEGVDLFEDYDDIPKNVQKILEKYDFEEGDYRTLEKAKKDVEKVGYTFEYSLDGTAYDLRKIGEKGKSGDEYAKGGLVTLYDDYDKDAGYIIEKENKYWTGKNWSDVKAYAESYKTKQEAEKKLKSIKMAKGGLVKINISDIEDSDFQSLSQIFESNDAAFSIDEAEEYVSMDLKGLPDGNEKQEALEIIGKYDVQRMDKGGKINWGEDLGDGFSIGNDVYIKDSSSRFYNKNGYLVGKIGQRLVVQVGEDDMYAVVSKEKVEKLNAPMAKGGNINSDLSDKELKDLVERLSKEKTLDKKEEYALMKAKYMLEKRDSSNKMAKGGKLPETIGGYKIDFSKWREDVIAIIEVKPNSAPFETFYLKGVGKTEKQAFQNLEKEYNSMKKSSYVVTFSIDDSGWIKSKPISAYTEEQASNILYESASMEGDVSILKIDKISMANGGSTPRTIKLTLSDKDSYDYTYKQDGATASITFGFGKEPFQYDVKKISKSLEPLKQDILDAFTIQGIKQHEYKGGFSESIKHLDTKVVYEDKMAEGGQINGNLEIVDFYVNEYPKDDIAVDINPKATFNGLYQILKNKGDAYKYIGVGDSVVRERVFQKLAEIKGVKYDVIYDMWMESDYAKGGQLEVGDMVMVDDSGYVKYFSGFDTNNPAKIISKDKGKSFGKVKYFYGLETADGKKPFNQAIESMLTKVSKDGGYMAKGGDTAAAEHNIKQAKYGARLVGKQKNLDINKNGKLDAEDFKMLRGEKMAMGGIFFDTIGRMADVPSQIPNRIIRNAAEVAKEDNLDVKIYYNTRGFFHYSTNKPQDDDVLVLVVSPSGEVTKMAKGGKVKFEDKVKAIKASLLKRKKVSPKVQKDYGKTYSPKEAEESAKRIVGAQTAKYELKKKFKEGGKTIAQTPAPKKDRVFGSSKNKAGSASSKKAASNIELNESIVKTLGEKAKKYNEKHSSKVSTSTLKAVMRRGMGAYSTSHRPTITGGAPNSRQAWGFARVNKFLLKKGGTKVKAAYVQDDDLI